MARQQVIGKRGEDIASEYLTKLGYTILERNWRIGKAEIDIIAKDGEILIFVEVKTRSSAHFGSPEESISNYKENLIIDAAGRYMEQINHDWEIRFDIISIVFDLEDLPIINHYKDAFYPTI
jgi:putative endonuclease